MKFFGNAETVGNGFMPLTISRKPGQAIVVDGPCTIRVSPDSRRVRLQIAAIPSVRIRREEIAELDPAGHVSDQDLHEAGIKHG